MVEKVPSRLANRESALLAALYIGKMYWVPLQTIKYDDEPCNTLF
jgi:hypothetical protein